MAKQRPGEKILLHHPQTRKEIKRTRRQFTVLKESGWREGPLPEPEPVRPVKKSAASNSNTDTGEGR